PWSVVDYFAWSGTRQPTTGRLVARGTAAQRDAVIPEPQGTVGVGAQVVADVADRTVREQPRAHVRLLPTHEVVNGDGICVLVEIEGVPFMLAVIHIARPATVPAAIVRIAIALRLQPLVAQQERVGRPVRIRDHRETGLRRILAHDGVEALPR